LQKESEPFQKNIRISFSQ